jgi:uroporphyrinogen-III synthase
MRRVGARRIWVTRTQPRATATAERVRALGLEPIVAPVLVSQAVAADIDLAGVDALAFTSATGVRAFADLSLDRAPTVFVVGEGTAAAARAEGFEVIRISNGDVRALSAFIAKAEPALVLNPTAREPAADLVALLAERGVAARGLVVYETVPTGAAVPPNIDSILIHSPRAARIVAGQITAEQASALSVFAISEAAAAPLRALPFARIATAPFPDEASLLDLLQA